VWSEHGQILTFYARISQLEDLLHSMGMKPTEHQMEEIVKELDQNHDGTIEFSEFLKVMAAPKRGSAAFKLMSRVSSCCSSPFRRQMR